MTPESEPQNITEVKAFFEQLTASSENARLELFLSGYDNSGTFLAVSADGVRRRFADFSNICSQYYSSLSHQSISTIEQDFQAMASDLVLSSWTGNIVAKFKNGDVWKMQNYSITYVLKKIGGEWKITRSHESALPPEITTLA
jgi:hypothetical protein